MNNQKTLGIERLFMIAKLLEIDVAEILELNKQTIKFFNTLTIKTITEKQPDFFI